MAGLVVQDLGGGDAAWTVVDDELWEQIQGLTDMSMRDRAEAVAWLCCNDSDVVRPSGFSDERRGRILRTAYTQVNVIEDFDLSGVSGVLALP